MRDALVRYGDIFQQPHMFRLVWQKRMEIAEREQCRSGLALDGAQYVGRGFGVGAAPSIVAKAEPIESLGQRPAKIADLALHRDAREQLQCRRLVMCFKRRSEERRGGKK